MPIATIAEHPVLLAVHYASPVISSILIFAAAWITFRKRRHDLLSPDEASNFHLLKDEEQKQLWNGGLVTMLLGMAQALRAELENLRDEFPNNPDLLYPISGNVPEVIKEYRHMQLLEFRSHYRIHLSQVMRYDPEFPSELAIKGFPLNFKSLDVLRMIEEHINVLACRLGELSSSV